MFNKAFILIIVCIVLFGVFYNLIVNRKIEKFETTAAGTTAAGTTATGTTEVQAAAAAQVAAEVTTLVDSQVSASGESNSIPVRFFADIDANVEGYDFLTTDITQYKYVTIDSRQVPLVKFNGDNGFIYIKQNKYV